MIVFIYILLLNFQKHFFNYSSEKKLIKIEELTRSENKSSKLNILLWFNVHKPILIL
ncbi:hypothetical protein M153_2220006620 [Pseudoloma neurophilia]|uniref:Uncharacterized protein n=1 Tax=Pseudoloma neurophilia TaxID=146866 RepID=A0A0R0M6G3_9MICR|nr:hypothetical protein M153_2220006620 [Pseudoloma neurophilia]